MESQNIPTQLSYGIEKLAEKESEKEKVEVEQGQENEGDTRKRPSPIQLDDDDSAIQKKTRFEEENIQMYEKDNPAFPTEIVEDKPNAFLENLFARLVPLPDTVENPLESLSPSELQELEFVLEFNQTPNGNNNESGWRNDWSGNLAYIDKEIGNPLFRMKNLRNKPPKSQPATGGGPTARGRKATQEKMSLLQWAIAIEKNESSAVKGHAIRRVLKSLLRHVCTYSYGAHQGTENLPFSSTNNNEGLHGSPRHQNHQYHKVPKSVVSLFSSIRFETNPLSAIEAAVRRASYDPVILKEDGWTTEKSSTAEGATGGAFRIGDKIRYEGSDAVVIAYIHDNDIGDLWKAMWIEDYVSFDLEAEELNLAKRKWDKVYKHDLTSASTSAAVRRRPSGREAAIGASGSLDFSVKGIEYGIVLASSYAKGSRPGVYWPARVMHASETAGGVRRYSSKSQKKLDLVFLAPYWNSIDEHATGKARAAGPSLSENEESFFNTNPLLQLETVDAIDEMVKEYPYGDEEGDLYLDVEKLRMSFRFTGLPKSAFPRFLDAYRLASSLREYARSHMHIVKKMPEDAASFKASAALFEVHPLAVQVPLFPTVILHLPFQYILSQQSRSSQRLKSRGEGAGSSTGSLDKEPVIRLSTIVNAMKPPFCWGKSSEAPSGAEQEAVNGDHSKVFKSRDDVHNVSSGDWLKSVDGEKGTEHIRILNRFTSDFPALSKIFDSYSSSSRLTGLLSSLYRLIIELSQLKSDSSGFDLTPEMRRQQLNSMVSSWAAVKRMGEDNLSSVLMDDSTLRSTIVSEWRRASERIYCYMLGLAMGSSNFKDLAFRTLVVTDSLCNEHRTSDKCLERRVRLPAALKGAKLAGAKVDGHIRLVTSVPDRYIDYVENKLLIKAHSSSYLKRMKSRCTAANSKDEILALTDDSDGNGGEDTRGSEGTWKAAVCGVAAAVAAADMVVSGICVNAFCVTRPPGHHAGRFLHPMKAVSNGFCILNPVACAAIHATTPVGQGGIGLSRVCVIDFDVHHGNGTQDILCSTYDPRFLYVSLHAGGAHINGLPPSDDPSDEPYGLAKNPKLSGIYPGRCGDISPHKGVLNLPLGARVMSHAVGTALLQHVTPAVDSFSPDLIILSAGFDAHKNDPMGLGGLSAEDFGNITEVACNLASKSCSGRVISVLEGGYGVPCCRPQKNTFLPAPTPAPTPVASSTPSPTLMGDEEGMTKSDVAEDTKSSLISPPHEGNIRVRPQPSKLLDLGEQLPSEMDDQVPYPLQIRLEKCNSEGFVECVYEHVLSLSRCNVRKSL